jgi:1-acyl-sn-glycerol-3-phosphate acyltransferase
MIDFSKVEKYSFKYDIFRTYVQFIHNQIFYKKYHILGKENIPPKGTPVVIVGNHQNGLMDALGICYALPRNEYPIFLARSDIFSKTFISKLLRWLKIMPVYRVRDGYDTVEGNNGIFDKAIELVQDGIPVILFPEAGHQQGHSLGTFKKGFARIAFDSAQKDGFQSDFYILPVGNHYKNYYKPRSELVINIGKPIKLSEFYQEFQENPPKARNRLAEVTRAKIKELILDIDDPDHYGTIDSMRKIVRPQLAWKLGLKFNHLPDALKTDQKLMQMLHLEKQEGREKRVLEMYRSIDEHATLLKEMNLTEKVLSDPKSLQVLLLRSVLFLLGWPFFLYGAFFGYLPWAIARRIALKMATRLKDKILFMSMAFGQSHLIFYPLQDLLLTILMMVFTGSFWWGLAFFITLFPTRMFATDYYYQFIHHARLFRGWRLAVRKNKLYERLHKQHQHILEQFDKWVVPV